MIRGKTIRLAALWRRAGQPGMTIALALAAAALPQAALPQEAGMAQPAAYTPPAGPVLLTRTLRRPLPDGKEVVTRRSYRVEIVRDGAGYRVDGVLADASVEAPPSLRELAEIERTRPDTGLFPIRLDARGSIVDDAGPQSDEAVERAAEVGASQIGKSGLAAIDMLQAQAFLRQFRARAARSEWPPDVFNPAPGHRSEQRAIPLPDGGAGHATIDIDARGAGEGGQLAAVDRIVITDLGGDKRSTREEWRLVRPDAAKR